MTSTDECPHEAIVLLDEALAALPDGCEPRRWQDGIARNELDGEYTGPVRSDHRWGPVEELNIRLVPTWTVALSDASFLEWIEDHWRRVSFARDSDGEIVWTGTRAGR